MYEPLPVADIFLDERNPRFAEPVGSQPEAINSLLALGSDKLLALARHIVLKGSLDPTNPPVVVRANGEAMMAEGNRRLAALKLLRNPDLAQASATRAALHRIRAEAEADGMDPNGPEQVTAWVVDDYEEVREWIELRHTGENGGVGTDPWDSYQSNTFRRKIGTPTDHAWLLVRAVISTFADDPALVADVRKVRDEKFTNLGRLLGRAQVVDALGISFSGDDVSIHVDDPFWIDVLRTVFSDLTGKKVDEIKTAAQQDHYAAEVLEAVRLAHPEGPSHGGGQGGEEDGGSSTGGNAGGRGGRSGTTTSGTGAAGGRGRAQGPEPKIFYGLTLRNVSSRTGTVLKQAQKVKIDDAVSVCAVMVRVIVELVATEVGVARNLFADSLQLRKKLRKVLLEVDPNCANPATRDKELEMAWILSQSDTEQGGLGVDEMNAYVHNFLADPSADRVRALSKAFLPLLKKLDELAGQAA